MRKVESTVGIDLETLPIAQGEVTVWDFAGQMEYTATHQFFLSIEVIVATWLSCTHFMQMVTYLLCFDLSKPQDEQVAQVSYWLDFLHSALPLPPAGHIEDSKWSIIIVGLRSDLQRSQSAILQPNIINVWKQRWPHLPIFPQIYVVSSTTSTDSVHQLLECVNGEIQRIFDKFSTRIPTSYRTLLHCIQKHPITLVHKDDLHREYAYRMPDPVFDQLLRYLHGIGRIVLLHNGLVFTNPTLAPKIAAKFVSPEEVRMSLLKGEDGVLILDRKEVGWVLGIKEGNVK